MAANEQYGFVFAVIFMIVFASLLAAMPAGLQGPEEEPLTLIPVDPNLVSGFAVSEGFNHTDFTEIETGIYNYEYTLGGRDWVFVTYGTSIFLFAKEYFFGLWLGQTDNCRFIAPDGSDYGQELSLTTVQGDSENGAVSYSLTFTTTGNSAGSFIIYWNVTEYPTFLDAWDDEEVYLLHGLGIDETAAANIGALLISLLFFRLPEVPALVNILLATPVWASIIFIIWYVVKETLPFV